MGGPSRLDQCAGQKIILQRQIFDLRMQGLHVDHRFRIRIRPVANHSCRALKKVVTPLLDLVRMNVERLHPLNKCLLALDRRHRHVCLGCRAVISA